MNRRVDIDTATMEALGEPLPPAPATSASPAVSRPLRRLSPDTTLRVHSIETFGTHDGPGIRLVLFLQGCPMKCLYCHNPDTRDCSRDAGERFTLEEILRRLERQRAYFRRGGGLTASGGEPTLQAPALLELFEAARERGFHTALDTGGAVWSGAVNRLYDASDLVILDVKHIDDARHRALTGVGLQHVLANAAYRERSGRPLWLRHVLIPGWTDQPESLDRWAAHFAGFRSLERVELLPYHTYGVHKYAALGVPYALEGIRPPSADAMAAARARLAGRLPDRAVVV